MSKTILVTGGAGFVGSHLCERLVGEGHTVISLDNYFTGSPENHVPGVIYRTGHTKDIATCVPETPDLVFHLGEYARVEKSFEDIELVWDLNIAGTFAVLEFCRARGSKLLYAGSSTKFAHDGAGRNQSPYAWSKAGNTDLVKSYADWFGLEYAITYFYNVYGPREMSGPYGTLIRIFTELYRTGQPLTVVSPGTQQRNFTHVNDIVSGLLLVGEHGKGDGYGIGADESFSVLDVANLFGGEVVMMPERQGNRLTAGVDNVQVKALGWKQQHTLPEWVSKVQADIGSVTAQNQRILVFSTTFAPIAGVTEDALCDVMKALPQVQFDVITTKYSPDAVGDECPLPNVTLYRLGYGRPFDKYLLPLLGAFKARTLKAKYNYTFQWALLASYAALAAIFGRSKKRVPLLITLSNQNLGTVPWYMKFPLRLVLGRADQVFALDAKRALTALSHTKRSSLIRSIGEGDAFANQVRVAYSNFLHQRIDKS